MADAHRDWTVRRTRWNLKRRLLGPYGVVVIRSWRRAQVKKDM